MVKLTKSIKEFVAAQRLGFLATVCPDGSPNLSPKGLTFVLDDTHIVIGNVRSPNSVSNLSFQPVAELNVVDRILRKGYRFKGTCVVHSSGDEFNRLSDFLHANGAVSVVRSIIVMTVEQAREITSPAYDRGASEKEVQTQWREYYDTSTRTHTGK